MFGRSDVRPRTESRAQQIQDFGVRNEELRSYAEGLEREPKDAPLSDRVAARFWYHTIELPGGVTTAGMFDHRALVPHYGIPDDLIGKRVLDIGAWDGFWAFEFERRGAEVVALDIEKMGDTDLPAGQREVLDRSGFDYRFGDGFDLAREALGSGVTKVTGNIYELDPQVLGTFDIVHAGDVLLHLESPTVALRQVLRVTRGQAMLVLTYDPKLKGKVVEYRGGWGNATWWIPSLDAAAQIVLDAGFADIWLHKTYRLQEAGGKEGLWRAIFFARPPASTFKISSSAHRALLPDRLRGLTRAAAVLLVAIGAFIGTRFIDGGGGEPTASSETSAPTNRSTPIDVSPLSIGVEAATRTGSTSTVEPPGGDEQGDVRAAAINIDRALVGSGRAQVYGTQHKCMDGSLVPSTPIQEPEEVDDFRAGVGFPPLEESVDSVSEQKDPCPDAGG
jgi:tRNA (mo5U34)-methyltransferase